MNKKGFTLIELLVTIVILGIILTIGSITVINIYNNSKIRNEEIFIGNLSKNIDTYISLYNNTIEFDKNNKILVSKSTGNVYAYKSTKEYELQDLINKNIVSEIINPRNNKDCTLNNQTFDIYVDDDYVYCFKMNLYCLEENNNINTCNF